MSIIKEKILLSNNDVNININLNTSLKLNNQKEEIDNYIEKESNDLINPLIDGEIKKYEFKGVSDNGFSELSVFRLRFFNGLSWSSDLSFAGFTEEEKMGYSLNLRNSFFILEFFRGYEFNSRTKIFTQYFTKLDKTFKNESQIIIENNNQLRYLNIPRFFINNKDTQELFLRVLFFNAKTGSLIPFFNDKYEGDVDERRQFFKITINNKNETWNVETQTIVGSEIINIESYRTRLNNTNETIKNKRQSYPEGSKFNHETGLYEQPLITTTPPPTTPPPNLGEININILFSRNDILEFDPSSDRKFRMRTPNTSLLLEFLDVGQILQTIPLNNIEFSFEDDFKFQNVQYGDYSVEINNVQSGNNRISLEYRDGNGPWHIIQGIVETSLTGDVGSYNPGFSNTITLDEDNDSINIYFRIIPLYIFKAIPNLTILPGFPEGNINDLIAEPFSSFKYNEPVTGVQTYVRDNPQYENYEFFNWTGQIPAGMDSNEAEPQTITMEENNIEIVANWQTQMII